MNKINQIFESISDQDLRAVLNEIAENSQSGIIGDICRNYARKCCEITGSSMSYMLLQTEICLYKEAANRYNNQKHCLQLLYDDQKKPIGWEMAPNTQEERDIITTIRDLQFFGFDDTRIMYNGLECIDPTKEKSYENLKSISWIQKKYHK